MASGGVAVDTDLSSASSLTDNKRFQFGGAFTNFAPVELGGAANSFFARKVKIDTTTIVAVIAAVAVGAFLVKRFK